MSAAAEPTTSEPGMFTTERTERAALSAALAGPEYRASKHRPATWAQIKNPGPSAMCTECAHRQHETAGRSGMRMQPRWRRSFPKKVGGDPSLTLTLCSPHAQGWRDRDNTDSA